MRESGVDCKLVSYFDTTVAWACIAGTIRFLTTLFTTVFFFLTRYDYWFAMFLSGFDVIGAELGYMIKLRFIAGCLLFCELLKVACLSLLSGEGDGYALRPKLPSSRPAAVRRPPLEFVSNGRLFLRLTWRDLY